MINLIVIFFIVPVHSNTIAPTVFQRERRALFQEARWYAQRGHFSNFYGLLHMTCSWKGLWSLIHVMHHSNSPPPPNYPRKHEGCLQEKKSPMWEANLRMGHNMIMFTSLSNNISHEEIGKSAPFVSHIAPSGIHPPPLFQISLAEMCYYRLELYREGQLKCSNFINFN